MLAPWAGVTTESGGVASVFRWVAFNQSYAHNFAPFTFELPAGRPRVQLYAVITGHGNDNHGCGEFCATEHRFQLGDSAAVTKENLLPVTHQQIGCAEHVDEGVTPNEYGTWLFGRDGWCNGKPVTPFVADVSGLIPWEDAGANGTTRVTLEYSAVWCTAPGECAPPDPGPPSTWQQAAPVMMVAVYVVIGSAPEDRPWWQETWAVGGAAGVAGIFIGGAAVAAIGWNSCRGRRAKPSLASGDVVAATMAEGGYVPPVTAGM